jgi:hypothetical protein
MYGNCFPSVSERGSIPGMSHHFNMSACRRGGRLRPVQALPRKEFSEGCARL